MEKYVQNSIVKTLAYFDLFHAPLTLSELSTFLWQPGLDHQFFYFFETLLSQSSQNSVWENKHGYYFLRGREHLIAQRERRVWYVEKKMKRAKKAANILRFLPFVRALFVCNQIQFGVSEKSDIDVLLVIKSGRLYLTRFFITVFLSLFRLRRNNRKVTDRICLSFYVSDNGLDFSGLRIHNEDVYFSYWLATLIPVYDPKNNLQSIVNQNSWVKNFLPHAFSKKENFLLWESHDTKFSLFFKNIFEKVLSQSIGDALENFTKKIQQRRMKKNIHAYKGEYSHVVVSDFILKFHENDRREKFKKEWQERWNTLLV